MGLLNRLMEAVGMAVAPAAAPASVPVREAASAQSADEPGWRRLGGDGLSSQNERDLSPMAQDRMQKVAEHLWQSNLLANRLVELPLAYLLAEGVALQCVDEDHQKLLNAFWSDPINNWPLKLTPRVRALGLLGEQCYIANVRDGDGFVRLAGSTRPTPRRSEGRAVHPGPRFIPVTVQRPELTAATARQATE